MPLLVGNSTQTGVSDFGFPESDGLIFGVYAAVASGSATILWAYVSADTATAIKIAIYDSSGSLLAVTSSIDVTGGSGWYSSAISATTITSGQSYRIGCIHDAGNFAFGLDAASPTFSTYKSGASAWPNAPASITLDTDQTPRQPSFYAEQAASAPTLTDVDSDESVTATQTGATITGTDLGATTGDRALKLIQGATEVTQTQTSGNATSGAFDVVFDAGGGPHLKYGSATAEVETSAGSDTLAITIAAPTGKAFVDLGTPNTTAANRITAVADLASGDQLEISNVQGGTIADVIVNADATFDCDDAVTAFDVRAWDASDSTWGSIGTQTISGSAPIAAISRYYAMLRAS